jgi:hypothetical protein
MSGYDRREAVRKGRVLLGTRVNHWAVLVAAVTALVTSALWYVVFGNAWLTLRGIDPSTAEWFGFEAMAVAGSVLHEDYPLGLYLIHVGDALQATLLMAFILGAWRRDARRDVEISPSASTSS